MKNEILWKSNSTISIQSMKYFSATITISIKASSLRTGRVVVPLEHCWLNPNRVIQVPVIFSHTNSIVPYHFCPFLFFHVRSLFVLIRFFFHASFTSAGPCRQLLFFGGIFAIGKLPKVLLAIFLIGIGSTAARFSFCQLLMI